jgi:hypothetical protein
MVRCGGGELVAMCGGVGQGGGARELTGRWRVEWAVEMAQRDMLRNGDDGVVAGSNAQAVLQLEDDEG